MSLYWRYPVNGGREKECLINITSRSSKNSKNHKGGVESTKFKQY